MNKLINVDDYPVRGVLKLLLKDKTTGKNIIWATDTYDAYGAGFSDKDQITRDILLQQPDIIKPRIQKSLEDQQARTRKKAEVFTPVWLCNQMNNYCDEEWFGRKAVFNIENEDHSWTGSSVSSTRTQRITTNGWNGQPGRLKLPTDTNTRETIF